MSAVDHGAYCTRRWHRANYDGVRSSGLVEGISNRLRESSDVVTAPACDNNVIRLGKRRCDTEHHRRYSKNAGGSQEYPSTDWVTLGDRLEVLFAAFQDGLHALHCFLLFHSLARSAGRKPFRL